MQELSDNGWNAKCSFLSGQLVGQVIRAVGQNGKLTLKLGYSPYLLVVFFCIRMCDDVQKDNHCKHAFIAYAINKKSQKFQKDWEKNRIDKSN